MSSRTMKTLPIDADWVRRMIRLADTPWRRDVVEAALTEYGWFHDTDDRHWPGTHAFWGDDPPTPGDEPPWRLDLGLPPAEGQGYVQLLCGLFWPAFGRPPRANEVDTRDALFPAIWSRHTEPTTADWDAEFHRIADLVSDELGPPEHTVPDDEHRHGLLAWRRGETAIVLIRTDDEACHSHYDGLFLTLCPLGSPMTTIDRAAQRTRMAQRAGIEPPEPSRTPGPVMHTLPIDRSRVRDMIRLAHGPWRQEAVERRFAEYGWTRPGEKLEWCAGPCKTYTFGGEEPALAPVNDGKLAWRLQLGCPPGSDHDGDSYVRLLCGLRWPAFGEDPEDDDEEYDESDLAAIWTTRRGIDRADWWREFDRIAALLREELGEPVTTEPEDELGGRRSTWHHNDLAVDLLVGDDIATYSAYDAMELRVRPMSRRDGK